MSKFVIDPVATDVSGKALFHNLYIKQTKLFSILFSIVNQKYLTPNVEFAEDDQLIPQ